MKIQVGVTNFRAIERETRTPEYNLNIAVRTDHVPVASVPFVESRQTVEGLSIRVRSQDDRTQKGRSFHVAAIRRQRESFGRQSVWRRNKRAATLVTARGCEINGGNGSVKRR